MSDTGRRAGRRRLTALVVAALVGAGCCAGAAALIWWTARFVDPLVGAITTRARGSEVLPELVPIALLALAGLGATAATRGWPRRVIGALVLLGGLLVAVRSVLAMTAAPAVLRTELTRPATAVGAPQLHPVGPILSAIGGLVVAVAGALVIAGAGQARGMGARYDAPSRRAERAARARQASLTRSSTDDPGAWWQAFDAGADPTTGPVDEGESKDAGEARPAVPDPADAGENPAGTAERRLEDPRSRPRADDGPADPVTDTHPGRIP